MTSSQFTRRLRFNKREYQEMLERMETRCGPGERSDGRRLPRYGYAVADIPMIVEHPEGGVSNFLVFGRNISRRGISVLHGGYVHPGSSCRIVLSQNDGHTLTLHGEVRHCRLFAGSCHEIGIHFEREVDPVRLTGSAVEKAADEPAKEKELSVSGYVLVAESFAPDHHLLEHYLSRLGLDLQIAETPGAVLDAIKLNPVDILLYGLSLTGRHGLRTLRSARALGFKGPVLVLSAETSPEILDQAREAGADAIVQKPFNIDMLLAQLRVYLGGVQPQTPLHSTAAEEPGMPPLIGRYVELVRRVADQVVRTYAEEEWEELHEYCCQLKGSGCSYGFQNLTVAAISVQNELARDRTSAEAKAAIDRLLDVCRAVEAVPLGSTG